MAIYNSLYLYKFKYNEQHTPRNIYKYDLSLLVICKNESIIIEEFVKHYKWQGVEHIYLIDNDSTDNMKELIQNDIYNGYITYYYMPEKHKQIEHYNTVFSNIKNETKWLIICDADEYIYNKTPKKTIASYLNTLDNSINSVTLSWKMFGSSGLKIQPDSIRKKFLWRKKDYDPNDKNVKNIVRTMHTDSLEIHEHIHKDTDKIYNIRNPSELALNHYCIMSEEYFKEVKMSRGDVNTDKFETIRDMSYFEKYDKNSSEVKDEELKNLVEE